MNGKTFEPSLWICRELPEPDIAVAHRLKLGNQDRIEPTGNALDGIL
jgi:hypothetical protein